MFAVLQASPAVSLDALVDVAQAFTPRFQAVGPFVLLDVGGLSALFGHARELGTALQAQRPDCRSIAIASTASRGLLLACGRPGLTVLAPEDEPAAVAALPLEVLVEVVQARVDQVGNREPGTVSREDSPSIGWRHPRDTHQAQHTRRPRASVSSSSRASRTTARALVGIDQCAAALGRWGIRTVGALAALPRPAVHARLGDVGVSWQRLASGEDDEPLVPWVAEPVFEETLELEWPVEGFEPLSFVLARVFEPLAAALERADRGAVSIRTALHLTTRTVHLRQLPLPAPMRDPKTLRTLVLLDLESHPPGAPIDRVQVRVEPTPGRVLQWMLFERAQPAPEQVATLVARLTALVGESHVGSPMLADTWRPGAFRMGPFQVGERWESVQSAGSLLPLAFRRFRLPVPVRVRMEDGRPVRLTTDRHGLAGGPIVQAAGPWRTSGEWWAGDPCREGGHSREREEPRREEGILRESRGNATPEPWDRDEWDIAMSDGTVYRLFVERDVGQWFLEGVFD
jgi:protein ImuB